MARGQVVRKQILIPKDFLEVVLPNHETISFEVSKTPEEGKAFKIEFGGIKRRFFETERKEKKEEATRQFILECLEMAEKNPELYERFYILIPKWEWVYKSRYSEDEFQNYPLRVCGKQTDWVESGLMIAYRISNGESWDSICHEKDNIDKPRVIKWKNDELILSGGADVNLTPSDFHFEDVDWIYRVDLALPSVTMRES